LNVENLSTSGGGRPDGAGEVYTCEDGVERKGEGEESGEWVEHDEYRVVEIGVFRLIKWVLLEK